MCNKLSPSQLESQESLNINIDFIWLSTLKGRMDIWEVQSMAIRWKSIVGFLVWRGYFGPKIGTITRSQAQHLSSVLVFDAWCTLCCMLICKMLLYILFAGHKASLIPNVYFCDNQDLLVCIVPLQH